MAVAVIPKEERDLIRECSLVTTNFVMNCSTVRYIDVGGTRRDEDYHLDVVKVCLLLKRIGAEYNFKKFPAINIKMRNPRGFIRVHKDGKIVTTGCKTKTCAIYTINRTIALLNSVLPFRIGAARGFENPRMSTIKNIVVTGNAQGGIDLLGLKRANKMYCVYYPEDFPGLTLKVPNTQGTMLLFSTGKFVITGPCTKLFVLDCLAKCMPLIRLHLKKPSGE